MKYTVTEVSSPVEDAEFIQVLNNNLYDGDADKRVKWFYQEQPSIRFLLRDENDNAIGTKGYSLRKFKTPLGIKIGAIAADLSVNKENRNLQAALFLEEQTNAIVYRDDVDFIYTIPNKKSLALFKRNKDFHEVGQFQRHIKLLSFDEVLKGKWYERALPIVNFLWRGITKMKLMAWDGGYKYIGPDFIEANHLWDTYGSERVMGERTTPYLTWRYETNPDPQYKVFNFSTGGKNTFIVYTIIKNRAYVVDMIYPSCDNVYLIRAFAEFERLCHKEKYSMIVVQYLGCIHEINILESNLWYRKHKPADKRLFVSTCDDELLKHLLSVENSFWFACDEDAIQ